MATDCHGVEWCFHGVQAEGVRNSAGPGELLRWPLGTRLTRSVLAGSAATTAEWPLLVPRFADFSFRTLFKTRRHFVLSCGDILR